MYFSADSNNYWHVTSERMVLNLPCSLKKYPHRKDFQRARIESSFQCEDSRGSINAMEVRRSCG